MKTVVLLSGGLDSTVLLAALLADGDVCHALSVHYGQRHRIELESAAAIAYHYDVPHTEIELPSTIFASAKSSQVGDYEVVPHGHYAEDSMKTTIVPNRNMLLMATAGAFALSQNAERIAYAAHAGDHAIYPDCRPQFVAAMQRAFELCDWKKLILFTPFLVNSKADIVTLGNYHHVPFEKTWSCYDPVAVGLGTVPVGYIHCGLCGTCVERKEAFQLAGVEDPTQYATDPHEVV